MMGAQERKDGRKWIVLFCAVYFISYLIRHCYAAALVEIISDLNVTRKTAGIALTGSFITYGVGQFISGYLGDKMPPQKIIFWGIISTSVINLLIAGSHNITFMNVVWIFSGFFHSLIWSPLVRIVSCTFQQEESYKHAIQRVSQCAYAGTIAVYLLTALFVAVLRWRDIFWLTGAAGLGFAAIWSKQMRYIHTVPTIAKPTDVAEIHSRERLTLREWLQIGMFSILLVIIGIGCLRDGISTWMPVYMSDVFCFNNSISILTSVVLPVFAIISVEIASLLAKRSRNVVRSTMLLMLFATVLCGAMYLSYSHIAALDLSFMALICCCLRGSSFLLTSYLPRFFERYGKVSLVSGITNGSLYIGSAVATYLLGAIADHRGWGCNIAVWGVVALICTGLCSYAANRWGSFQSRINQ